MAQPVAWRAGIRSHYKTDSDNETVTGIEEALVERSCRDAVAERSRFKYKSSYENVSPCVTTCVCVRQGLTGAGAAARPGETTPHAGADQHLSCVSRVAPEPPQTAKPEPIMRLSSCRRHTRPCNPSTLVTVVPVSGGVRDRPLELLMTRMEADALRAELHGCQQQLEVVRPKSGDELDL